MSSMLEKTKEEEGQVIESPPSLIPFYSNLSCQHSTHGHGHATNDMLHTTSN
jgi:hypothetical protein